VVWILEYWNIGMMENQRISKLADFGICWNLVWILEYWKIGRLEGWNNGKSKD
jgi:hypothetical protein